MSDEKYEWTVWDDGLDEAAAIRIRNWRRRRDSESYEFRVRESNFHGGGYFHVEARRKRHSKGAED